MIGALQTTRADGPSQISRVQPSVPRSVEQRETARGDGQAAPFRETRGPTVAGGTLIAAQIAASEPAKDTRETGTDPRQSTTVGNELTEQEREQIRDLQARDREVRAHEQAHATAGGQYAGSPEYEMERGPDGRSYAVGGHVSISTSPIAGDPEATIAKMEVVKRAALAPVEPSGADRSVAADAEAKRADARAELDTIRAEERKAQLEESPGEAGESADAAAESIPSRPQGERSRDAVAGPATGLPGLSEDGDNGDDPFADTREEDALDGSGFAERREDEAIARDFAAFLNQTGTERTRADLQPGLSAQRQGIDIRL